MYILIIVDHDSGVMQWYGMRETMEEANAAMMDATLVRGESIHIVNSIGDRGKPISR